MKILVKFSDKQKKRIRSLIGFLLLAMLAVAIIPLVWVGVYAHPSVDDYTYGYLVHCNWNSSHSLFKVISAAAMHVKECYFSWQGTFSSVFLMSLTPAAFAEGSAYVLTPVLMIGAIVISVFSLFYVLLIKLLKADFAVWLSTSSVTVFLMLETIYSPVNGMYWYNGSVHYVFMHSMMIIMVAMAMFIAGVEAGAVTGKRMLFPAVIGSVTAILSAGSNYSTALLGFVLIIFIAAVSVIIRKKFSRNVIIAGIYFVAFLLSMLAPGNAIRGESFDGMSPFGAVMESFRVAFSLFGNANWIQILFVVICIAPGLSEAVKNVSFKFKFPVLFSLISFSLVACMNAPLLYAMGGAGVPRQVNILKMFFQLMLVINVLYWIGWISNLKKAKISLNASWAWILCSAIFVVGTFTHFKLDPLVLNDYSSYAAYITLRTGEAQAFDKEYRERIEVIKKSGDNVEVDEYTVKPYLLFVDDITSDPDNWKNVTYGVWWDKQSIAIK